MERGRRNLIIGIGVVAVLALVIWGAAYRGSDVETVKVRVGDITQTVEEIGYVQATAESGLYAPQAASVAQLNFEAGQAVKAGQTVAVLENLELKVQVSDVESGLTQAEATSRAVTSGIRLAEMELKDARDKLERVKVLFDSGAVSRTEYEQAVLLVESAQARMEQQESQLQAVSAQIEGLQETREHLAGRVNELVLRSSVDGVVLILPVKEGQVVAPGTLVATIAGSNFEVKSDILGDDLTHVAVGQTALITAPGLGQEKLTGQVSRIYPQAEEKHSALGIVQQRVPVIISLENTANLKPGYEVDVAIQTLTHKNVMIIPRELVQTAPDGRQLVKLVVKGKMKEVPVKTGITNGTDIEITEGLTAGADLSY